MAKSAHRPDSSAIEASYPYLFASLRDSGDSFRLPQFVATNVLSRKRFPENALRAQIWTPSSGGENTGGAAIDAQEGLA